MIKYKFKHMTKTWQIMLMIAIGFIIGIAIYISTTHKELPNLSVGEVNNSPTVETNNMENQIEKPLDIKVLKEGSGTEIKNGQKATVHYVGTLENGTTFDSSRARGIPFSFTLGEGKVIKGWELGILGMKVGELRKLTIQPEYGYGAYGAGEIIPPNAVLIFEVELLQIN